MLHYVERWLAYRALGLGACGFDILVADRMQAGTCHPSDAPLELVSRVIAQPLVVGLKVKPQMCYRSIHSLYRCDMLFQ